MIETENFEAEIRKDTPLKPIMSINGALCPVCSRQLRKPIAPYRALSGRIIKRDGDAYCSRCGQRIDWSGNVGGH